MDTPLRWKMLMHKIILITINFIELNLLQDHIRAFTLWFTQIIDHSFHFTFCRHNEVYTWSNVNCCVHNIIVGKLWIELVSYSPITTDWTTVEKKFLSRVAEYLFALNIKVNYSRLLRT